jgi:hypothetical protein
MGEDGTDRGRGRRPRRTLTCPARRITVAAGPHGPVRRMQRLADASGVLRKLPRRPSSDAPTRRPGLARPRGMIFMSTELP